MKPFTILLFCPKCDSSEVDKKYRNLMGHEWLECTCGACGFVFSMKTKDAGEVKEKANEIRSSSSLSRKE